MVFGINMKARYTYVLSDRGFDVGPKCFRICFEAITYDFIRY